MVESKTAIACRDDVELKVCLDILKKEGHTSNLGYISIPARIYVCPKGYKDWVDDKNDDLEYTSGEDDFNDFSDLFSKLSLNLDLINDENNFNKSWNFLRNPIVELWKTFARGLRVNFKDDYYDSRVESWNRKFKSRILHSNNKR